LDQTHDVSSLFALNADQQAIFEMARDFAKNELAPKAIEWDQAKHFPTDVLQNAAAQGMGGIYISDEFGGSGLTRLDAALIFEALSTGCPSVAAYISIHNMTTWMIDRFGNHAQRAKWIPGLCAMESLGSYCLTEPSAGSDAAALKMRAVADGDSYVLNGTKQFISGAGAADIYVVTARTSDAGANGISAFVIEKGTPGLSFANEKKMGWNAQPTRQVICEDARLPKANLLGDEGQGFKIAMAGLDGGRLNIGACSLGGAQAAIDKATSYMHDRQAFGRKLTNFQALQFKLQTYEVARTGHMPVLMDADQIRVVEAFLQQS
jgi:alkylation response protein AidB-like acyl-CoA dehydrogenase